MTVAHRAEGPEPDDAPTTHPHACGQGANSRRPRMWPEDGGSHDWHVINVPYAMARGTFFVSGAAVRPLPNEVRRKSPERSGWQ